MKAKHYALLGVCLASIATMVSSLPDWNEAMKPSFVGGVLGVIGTQLAALYTERPNERRPR